MIPVPVLGQGLLEGMEIPRHFLLSLLVRKGRSSIQRVHTTKRHGCWLLEVKAHPHRGAVYENGE